MKRVLSLFLVLVMSLSITACNNSEPIETDVVSTSGEVIESVEETTIPKETTIPEDPIMSKEEMLAIAEEYTVIDIHNDSVKNLARAKQKYCNKTILLTGVVYDILEDHVELLTSNYMYINSHIVDVYLPLDELVLVESGQRITVVGTITDDIIDKSESIGQRTYNTKHYQMHNAYFVNDIYELTGTLRFYYMEYMDSNGKIHNRDGLPEEWVIGLAESDDSGVIRYHMEDSIPVNHVVGQTMTTVTFCDQKLRNYSKITVSGKILYKGDKIYLKEAELISVH